jgi:hypothetical protein
MNQSLSSAGKSRSELDSKARSICSGDLSRHAIAATLRQSALKNQISHHQSVSQNAAVARLSIT